MKKLRLILFTLLILHASFAIAANGASKLPQTGQTTSYSTGDDGALKVGVPWPEPRFTDNNNGTVTDNLTGLIWLKNANCFGTQGWAVAISNVNTLANGACSLIDGSIAGEWRLPNVNELESLVNEGAANSAIWLNNQGFIGVQAVAYWSSGTYAGDSTLAWYVGMKYGDVKLGDKIIGNYVWPVRGGQ